MVGPVKLRLDELLVLRGLAGDLREAQAMIGAGEVYLHENNRIKAGQRVEDSIVLRCRSHGKFVSRGGLKLEAALLHFKISPVGWRCLDVGASSGGFTDCLLQQGAAQVFAVDVGYGQLDWKIRTDPRVVVMERCNARQLSLADFPEAVDLAVIDASFISLTKFIPALIPLFADKRIRIVALIKPQFELPKDKIEKGGIVTSAELHQEAIAKVSSSFLSHGLITEESIPSPILGQKGNREFLIYAHS